VGGNFIFFVLLIKASEWLSKSVRQKVFSLDISKTFQEHIVNDENYL